MKKNITCFSLSRLEEHCDEIGSYVSTEKYGKFAYLYTVNVLKNIGLAYSIYVNGTMCHYYKTQKRNNYSPASSL